MDTNVATPQAVATVIAVEGQAFARDPAGQMRQLKPGDALLEGDTIVTMPGGQVQLAFLDGKMLTLLPNESFQFTAETSPTSRPDVAEVTLQAGEAERIIQALERGEDIGELLDPTAAGLVGGANNFGNDFVRLLRIVEGVSPLSYEFGNNAASEPLPEFGSGTLPLLNPETPDAPVIVGTVTLNAPASMVEGGAIVYSATVDVAPQGSPLVLTLSNGLTITIPVGAFSGTSAPAPVRADDVLAQGDTPVAASVVGASGGGYTTVDLGAPASTTVTDDLDVTTVSLSADAAVAEGGNIVYTASLNNPAGAPVTVTLSNGATITIAAGASTGTASVPAPANTVHVDASTVTTTITTATGGNFESLAVNPASVTTAISDTIDSTTVSLTASPSVVEGGSIVYTATLNNAPQTPVTVTLSNGSSITIVAGASTGSVSVPAPTDDVYVDAGSVSATIASATGGNFESLVIDPAPAITAVSDTINTTTISLSASPSVAEGGSIIYTASLTAPAQSAVTVTLSNGSSISIAAGASLGSVSVPAPSDDVYVDASSVSATIASATGGNFESLVIDPAAATTSITDTLDTTTVSLTASPSVAEGGSIVYTASLTSPAGTAVTVNLSNGAAITIAAGASSGSVSFAAPTDDVYVDAGAVSVTIDSATGGNFEALAINPAAATTSITDTLDTTTVSLTASPSVAEGGSITYTASLTSAAQSPVSVTLSNGAVVTIAAGASSGSVSFAAPTDDVYVDAGAVSVTIDSATGGNFESLAINPAAATTSITDTLDTTTVSLTASPSVAEGGSITYTASLTSAAQSPVSVMLSNGALVTIAAGASSGSVSFAAPTDDVYVDAGAVSVTIDSAIGGNFEALAINPAAATTSITDTLDTTTVSLTGSGSITEGTNGSYTVSLTSPAQTDVTVTLSYSGSATGGGTDYTGITTVTIPAGSSSASFTISTVNDAAAEGTENFTVSLVSASSGNFESLQLAGGAAGSVTTNIIDDDVATVSLSATPSLTEAGGNIVYTATITQAPVSAMSVTLSNGVTITIAAGSLSGSTSVPLAAEDDVYIDPDSVSATISSISGGGILASFDPSPAITSITDTIDSTTLSLSASPLVAEGGSIVYTASLTAPAQSAVTVTLSNGSSISIAAGASLGSVSVPAPSDDVYVDASSVSATIASATGGNFESLVIDPAAATTSITDTLDTTTVSLTATPSVAEGGSIVYTASLTSPAGTAVTVNLSNGAAITIAAGTSPVPCVRGTGRRCICRCRICLVPSITGPPAATSSALAINPAAATTSITDTLDTTTVSLTASPSVAEGGSIVYTASLNNPAGTAVTVNLSNGAAITIAAGASSGSVSFAAPTDDVYVDAGAVSVTIDSATGGNFEAWRSTRLPPPPAITDTLDTTTVSLTASPSVAEGGSIVYTASSTTRLARL